MERNPPVKRFERHPEHWDSLVRLMAGDVDWFDLLQGGPQASHYLHAFSPNQDVIGNRDRLRKLFDFGYLDRPVGELNDPLVICDKLVYSLGKKGKETLEKRGRLNRLSFIPKDNQHNFMDAAIDANLRLGIKKAGFRYMSQEEILSNAPDETQKAPIPLAITINGVTTIFDRLFGIDYGTGVRIFGRETDRNTEQVPKHVNKKNTIENKLEADKAILKSGAAKLRFNVPNFYIIYYTTNEARAELMREKTREVFEGNANNILFKAVKAFDTPTFRTVPLDLDLVTTPYLRTGTPYYINNPERQ